LKGTQHKCLIWMINITIKQWNAALNHDDVIWRNWRSASKAIIPRCLFIVPSLKVRSIRKSWTRDYQDHVISWSRLQWNAALDFGLSQTWPHPLCLNFSKTIHLTFLRQWNERTDYGTTKTMDRMTSFTVLTVAKKASKHLAIEN